MIEQNSICRNETWMATWIGSELVMMSGLNGYCLSVSETAGRIWDLLEQPTTVASICHALQVEYQAEPAEIRNAVLPFLEQMLQENAILVGHNLAC